MHDINTLIILPTILFDVMNAVILEESIETCCQNVVSRSWNALSTEKG